MKLINRIEVSGFRSLRHEHVSDLSHISAFTGKNSSGKSNILRALNLFFNDEIEPDIDLDWERDFNQYMARVSRRRRRIEIAVEFVLPDIFNFRKELKSIKNLFDHDGSVVITKIWEPGLETIILLDRKQIDKDLSNRLIQFLDLIKFRYIPNRVLPFDVIENEQDSLARRLVKRLAARKQGGTAAFEQLKQQATELSSRLAEVFNIASPDTQSVQLNVPGTWEDVIFALGYSFISKHNAKVSTSGELEGAGNQSLLMLETLRLIDTDYSMSFGWRQATIWAYEEPESSLHYSLEALVATLLRRYSTSDTERLQIIISTHSNIFAENSDVIFHVDKSDGETKISNIPEVDLRKGYLSNLGVTSYNHPILFYPRKVIVIVEGKYDYVIMQKIKSFLSFCDYIEFTYLGILSNDPEETGGDDSIFRYVKAHRDLIDSRFVDMPVIILLDWDSTAVFRKLSDVAKRMTRLKVLLWPESDTNPELSSDFKGIERSIGTSTIRRAAENTGVSLVNRPKTRGLCFDPRDKEILKSEISSLVSSAPSLDDLTLIRNTVERLVGEILVQPAQSKLV